MKTMNFLKRVRYPFIFTGAVSAGSVILLRYLVLRYSLIRVSSEDISNMQNFIQLLGVLYGIYIARLMDDAIKYSDDTDLAFSQEARATMLLYDNVSLLNDKKYRLFKSRTKSVIRSYVVDVIEHPDGRNGKGEKLIYELRKLINNRMDNKKNLREESRLLMLINNIDYVISTRANRLSSVLVRAPSVFWFLALVFSFLWIIPFATFNYINEIVSSTLIGVATFVITAFLLMIYDIGNSRINEYWSFRLDEWDELLAVIKE